MISLQHKKIQMDYKNKMIKGKDIELKCVESSCGQDFVFSIGEQEYFRDKQLSHAPTRCLDCRRRRRAQSNVAN